MPHPRPLGCLACQERSSASSQQGTVVWLGRKLTVDLGWPVQVFPKTQPNGAARTQASLGWCLMCVLIYEQLNGHEEMFPSPKCSHTKTCSQSLHK